jgi:heat-inducible transcriptional repressor
MPLELTDRQSAILRLVVDEYVATGQPVGSRRLVERAGMAVSPSTVRSELAELEHLGLLTHPHTSAGRVPTEDGYRYYAAEILQRPEPRPRAGTGEFPLDLTVARSEIESALQATTEMLAGATRLLALVSAPPLETTTVRHVEVLLLQPSVVMCLVITSTGDVSKRVFTFGQQVDPGLVDWAAAYLNESLAGLRLGTAGLRRRFEDESLSPPERAFLDTLKPVFTDLLGSDEQRVYVGGAATMLADARDDEHVAAQRLLEVLERRAALLRIVGDALDPGARAFVRLGGELDHPGLHDVAMVGASYGLAARRLGAVSLFGPVRMDYEKAIHSVRAAAHELSRFVEEVYESN